MVSGASVLDVVPGALVSVSDVTFAWSSRVVLICSLVVEVFVSNAVLGVVLGTLSSSVVKVAFSETALEDGTEVALCSGGAVEASTASETSVI